MADTPCIAMQLGRRGSRVTHRPLPGGLERGSTAVEQALPSKGLPNVAEIPSGNLSRDAVPKLKRVRVRLPAIGPPAGASGPFAHSRRWGRCVVSGEGLRDADDVIAPRGARRTMDGPGAGAAAPAPGQPRVLRRGFGRRERPARASALRLRRRDRPCRARAIGHVAPRPNEQRRRTAPRRDRAQRDRARESAGVVRPTRPRLHRIRSSAFSPCSASCRTPPGTSKP